MRKTIFLAPVLLLLLILSGCSRSYPRTQIEFGILAAQKGLWDEAIFRWKKVLQSNPDSAAAHNNLAVAYEKKGLWDDAQKEYEKALELSPKNAAIKANYDKFKKRMELREKEKRNEKKNEKKKKSL
ncbi:MAG: tetratricopeptide repeat protein [Candidatus Aminicenantales bacterium]